MDQNKTKAWKITNIETREVYYTLDENKAIIASSIYRSNGYRHLYINKIEEVELTPTEVVLFVKKPKTLADLVGQN